MGDDNAATAGTKRKKRSNGEGAFHERGNGLIAYSISLGRDIEGRRLRPTVYGRTKTECRDLMAEKIVEIKRLGGVKIPSTTTIKEWLEEWLERKSSEVAPKTCELYRMAVNVHVLPYLGRMRLDQLRVRDVDAWLRSLAAKKVGGRIRQVARMVLGNAINDAMRLEIIERNVVSLVRSPKHRAAEFPVWDIEQALAFLKAARECRFHAFWTLWLTAGPRPHELLGARLQDVSGDRMTLTKQARRGGGDRVDMKTESSRRTLKLTPIALAAIAAHKERLLADGLRASPWLFPNPERPDRPVPYITLVRLHYDEIVKSAFTIDAKTGEHVPLPRIRPYDLRHTYATLALKAGVPIKVVSETLGHANIGLTLKTYQHVLEAMRDEHIDKIQELFGAA